LHNQRGRRGSALFLSIKKISGHAGILNPANEVPLAFFDRDEFFLEFSNIGALWS
jgi:hypothetical protein